MKVRQLSVLLAVSLTTVSSLASGAPHYANKLECTNSLQENSKGENFCAQCLLIDLTVP